MWHSRPTSSCDTVNTLLNLTQWTHFWVWHDGLPSRCDMMDAHLVVNTGKGTFWVRHFVLTWVWQDFYRDVDTLVMAGVRRWKILLAEPSGLYLLLNWGFGGRCLFDSLVWLPLVLCRVLSTVYRVSEMWYDGRNLRRDTVKTVSLRGWHILKNTLMFYTEKCNSMNVL